MATRFTSSPARIMAARRLAARVMAARTVAAGLLAAALLGVPVAARAAETQIPHRQDRPPNDPRDPQTAARMMTVPEGFAVEVVAAEPDLVNPVAMAIDERGRFWIAESLEYPREKPGPGRDRIKVFEDADGDGTAETTRVFLDGLNIPSGVQVGHGGVWIANAPDILFVPDANRDGIADGPAEVVVTGFGRTDTHELPNSLTWGPDGWLYGLNGVFNHSHVRYPPTNPNHARTGGDAHPGWPISCAMFRIHPRTREFQVFCEGTSNPWGIAFDDEGQAFISACVIDHLWHLVETGYYHRQGGPYPPHTWKIESIVSHKHQKAAYCGITWFDSDAYPEQYRRKLYMGNIHGGCLNVDRVERSGSTYAGFGEPDFLTANDAWFMPVAQKTGADGCLYVLDWYDRYHCHQDATRDPAGIDRLKGRLYRVRYVGTDGAGGPRPKAVPRDLGAATSVELLGLLSAPNGWARETALRILHERTDPETTKRLLSLAFDTEETVPTATRRMATFALVGRDLPASDESDPTQRGSLEIVRLLAAADDPVIRSWGIRLLTGRALAARGRSGREAVAGDAEETDALVMKALVDADPRVRLQGLIHVTRLDVARLDRERPRAAAFDDAVLAALRACGGDPLLQRIGWQAVKSHAAHDPHFVVRFLADSSLHPGDLSAAVAPRLVDWLLAHPVERHDVLVDAIRSLLATGPTKTAGSILARLTSKVQTGEIGGDMIERLRRELSPLIQPVLAAGAGHPLQLEVALLRLSWKDSAAAGPACRIAENAAEPPARRLAALRAVVAAQHPGAVDAARLILDRAATESKPFLGEVLATLGRLESPAVGRLVVEHYDSLPPECRPRAIELVTQRPAWAIVLLEAVAAGRIPAATINLNQARRLNETGDAKVRDLLARHWGQVREGRSPDRDEVIVAMRALIRSTPGDAVRGRAVFAKTCGQCHKLHGEGAEVGPDITLNGRNDYTQLLSNVFDPNLVIGAGYRSCTVVTDDGRAITGLLAEDGPERVVLKVQGGRQEVIPRAAVEALRVGEQSLMPEQLERQFEPQEMADLFAYLTLDKPPEDPTARRLPGVYDEPAGDAKKPLTPQ